MENMDLGIHKSRYLIPSYFSVTYYVTQNETFISIQHLQYIMWRHIWYKELPLVFCGHRDGAEVWVTPEERHIKTTGTLSTQTLRAALALGGKDAPEGCTITHKPEYTLLKVKRRLAEGNDYGNKEVGA